MMFDNLPEQKINKKRLENLERLKKKQKLKISKNKQKKSAQLAARKQVKETIRHKKGCGIKKGAA